MRHPPPLFLFSFSNDLINPGKVLSHLKDEEGKINDSMTRLQDKFHLIYSSLKPKSSEAILQKIRDYPDQIVVFHFSGHGNSEKLQLNQADFRNSELASFLSTQENLKLIFLNACDTHAHLKPIVNAFWNRKKEFPQTSLPAILYTTGKVEDQKATLFSEEFYTSLEKGQSLRKAFEFGKRKLAEEDSAPNWNRFSSFVRSQTSYDFPDDEASIFADLNKQALEDEDMTMNILREELKRDNTSKNALTSLSLRDLKRHIDNGDHIQFKWGLFVDPEYAHIGNWNVNLLQKPRNINSAFRKDLTGLNVPKPNRNSQIYTPFVGRIDEFLKMKEAFLSHQMVLLRGFGGIGKTALARQFVLKHYEAFDHIAWITMSSKTEFTTRNGLIDTGELFDTLQWDGEERQKWKTLAEEAQWKKLFSQLFSIVGQNLLIIDNAQIDLEKFLEELELGKPEDWDILIMSRNTFSNLSICEIKLSSLSDLEAEELFLAGWPDAKNSAEQLKDILTIIGNHPLLIVVISKLLRFKATLTPAILLANLKSKNWDGVLGPHHPVTRTVLGHMLTTFDLSMVSDRQLSILQVISFLPVDPVFLAVEELWNLMRLVSSLERYEYDAEIDALIERGWINSPQKLHITCHPIIQHAVHLYTSHLGKEEDLEMVKERVLDAIKSFLSEGIQSPSPWLLSAIVTNMIDYWQKELAENLSIDWIWNAAKLFHEVAQISDSLRMYDILMDILAKEGESLRRSHAAYELGLVLADTHRVGDAIKHIRASITFLEEADSSSFFALLAERKLILGDLLRRIDHITEATTEIEQAIQLLKNEAESNPDLLADAYRILAGVYNNSNKEQARKWLLKAIEIRKEYLEWESPRVMETVNQLAIDLYHMAAFEEVRRLYEVAFKKIPEPNPEEYFDALWNDAIQAIESMEYEKAFLNYSKVLAHDLNLYGEEHPRVAEGYYELGELSLQKGIHAQAEGNEGDFQPFLMESKDYLKKAISILRSLQGNLNPTLKNCFEALAEVHEGLEEYEQAQFYTEEANKISGKNKTIDNGRFRRTLGRAIKLFTVIASADMAIFILDRMLYPAATKLFDESHFVPRKIKEASDYLRSKRQTIQAENLKKYMQTVFEQIKQHL